MKKIKFIIQCRTKSTRLPGKAFLPIKGISSVVLATKRAMNQGADVVVAIPDVVSDDNLAILLRENEVPHIRGPLEDVLKRYVIASDEMQPTDYIVRLTADNIFPDGNFIKEIIDYTISNKLLYCSTDNSNGLPYGLGCEIFTVGLLKEADEYALDSYSREHVTPWMREQYKNNRYLYKTDMDLSNTRCTLDTIEDYLVLEGIFREIDDPIRVRWQELCTHLYSNKKKYPFKKHYSKQLPISEFTLGTAQIGMRYGITNTHDLMSDQDASKMLNTALTLGICTFDSARGYGVAERRLSQVTSSKKCTIVTKLSPLFIKGNDQHTTDFVRASVYQSCYELNVRSLDVLMLHRFWQYEDKLIWNELLSLQKQGVIQGLGISINTVEEAKLSLQEEAVKFIQLPYNILDWRWENNAFQAQLAKRKDVTIFARSIFLQGLLISQPLFWPQQFKNIANEVSNIISKLVNTYGRKNALDLCVAYVRAQPWIDSLVIGCINEEQLKENLALFNQSVLSQDDCLQVREMLPRYQEQLLNPSLW